MIDLDIWIKNYLNAVDACFPERAWFVGLQGSYGRGEATEDSDIDMVVILDHVTEEDLIRYRRMLDTLPYRDRQCGFLSGREEIFSWDPADLFQLFFDTTPLRGSLEELRILLDDSAVERAIKMGCCNIYHGCVHNMLYGRSENVLMGLYKAASFVVQAICYRSTGVYVRRIPQLRKYLSTAEREIVDTFLELKRGGSVDLDEMSRRLFTWVGGRIRS